MNTFTTLKMMPSIAQKVFSTEQVKATEPVAAQIAGISLYELMERAGLGVFDELQLHFPQARRLLVLVGHGNNGGDGFVLARLARQAGIEVTLVEIGEQAKFSEDTRAACQRWLDNGGQNHRWPHPLHGYDLVVDAMLGTGIQGEVRSPYREVIDKLQEVESAILSIDVPSGLNADTGSPGGTAVQATRTVTLVAIKPGLVTGRGRQYTGKLSLARLGIGATFDKLAAPFASLIRLEDLPPLPPRPANSHKGMFGRLLCIGGNQGMPGSMRLCAEAALRTGAGLVKVLCHPQSQNVVVQGCPELMLADPEENPQQLFDWASCFAIGPGLGQDPWAQEWLNALLSYQQQHHKPMVLDADALNLVAASKNKKLPGNTVLTPHPAEAGRLLGLSAAEIEQDRYKALDRMVQLYSASLILKGAGSLVSANQERYVICDGNPGMASPGTGDLLTGVIAGLLAQGMDTGHAVLRAACLHGAAGDMAAEDGGERGMIASDLLPFIRRLVNH
ncbi:NAD(P)H-hydrate dehydratase [Bowmanella dokdonensis]|uniref:Bifunctional NAD(P)H-hydrate repair enzyme n=1 Tax=Bowmanella dokdonensis TaxID=751969 RepID=A0A939DJ79_9ALTE|nr:NAD(P)H-hydrate dehydratase [Bowmanella dokdonensis]MBN7823714.1 NAD(P)H-hydrate dehydratase [Bowmanella dokdonensis]